MQENDYFCIQIESILNSNRILIAYIASAGRLLFSFLALSVLAMLSCACSQRRDTRVETPWGVVNDSVYQSDDFDIDRIQSGGEMIMLTLSGPDTYYDYRGRSLGAHYMLCQRFADTLGVSLRVEVCRDTVDMLNRLAAGDADVIAYPLPRYHASLPGKYGDSLIFCGAGVDSLGTQWAVSSDKPRLAEALDKWFRPDMFGAVRREEAFLLSSRSITRRVYSPMLNRKDGIISHYDELFKTYCQPIRWDWRLMAAQCYQESTFDPQAKSWAGACGLMQIMPATASYLGLPMERIYDPESNIAAAARYLGELETKLKDIPDRSERMNFVLACYNGGYYHIRDAMALARRDGRNPYNWDDVARYVLQLSEPQYYRDPLVKCGYMRGSETVDYVARIRQRWQSYHGVKGGTSFGMTPRKAKHRKQKYQN